MHSLACINYAMHGLASDAQACPFHISIDMLYATNKFNVSCYDTLVIYTHIPQ